MSPSSECDRSEESPASEPHAARRQRMFLRSGDHRVFEDLFEAHSGEVFATALRLVEIRAVAEDVTSETFLIAWKRRETLVISDRPLRGWLLAIATNQALNARRASRRRSTFLASGRVQIAAEEDFAEETIGRLDDARRLDATRRAMSSLTRRELEVVSLCGWSGLTYQDAAVALGIPVGTVRSRLNRARLRLRSIVSDDPPDSTAVDPSTTLRQSRIFAN